MSDIHNFLLNIILGHQDFVLPFEYHKHKFQKLLGVQKKLQEYNHRTKIIKEAQKKNSLTFIFV